MKKEKRNHATETPLTKSRNKDTKNIAQKRAMYMYLIDHIATATMISKALEIPQKNVCRYKRQLEKSNILWQVAKEPCKLTGYKAWYITCNSTFNITSHE